MDKEFLFDYLKALMDRKGKYHDHKELSAWAALVLYLVFCGAVLQIKGSQLYTIIQVNDWRQPVYLVVLVAVLAVSIVAIFTFLFIKNQLKLKDGASSQEAASIYYLTKLVTETLDERQIGTIQDSKDTETLSSHVLPNLFLEKAMELNKKGTGARDRTRLYIYIIMGAATVFVLAIKATQVLYSCPYALPSSG